MLGVTILLVKPVPRRDLGPDIPEASGEIQGNNLRKERVFNIGTTHEGWRKGRSLDEVVAERPSIVFLVREAAS